MGCLKTFSKLRRGAWSRRPSIQDQPTPRAPEPYVYRPLLKDANSIRLLQIFPGVRNTEIHCVVFDYSFRHDRSASYEALSYVWGDPATTHRILIQDANTPNLHGMGSFYLGIATNLHIVMQRLRDPYVPRMVWIDAVCINQDDL